jgi:hypothetical protein
MSIDAALEEADPTEAARRWRQVQGEAAFDLPYDVLYFRTNAFAFRMDRVRPTSWAVDIGGDIWFFWSWILLDPALEDPLFVSLSGPAYVESGSVSSISIRVTDPSGAAVASATVAVGIRSGSGVVNPSSGLTDANGNLVLTFLAPNLAPGVSPVTTVVEARAGHIDYGTSRYGTIDMVTYAPGGTPLVFVPYSHPSGFSLPIPDNWTIQEDQIVEGETIELTLLGPTSAGIQTRIVVDTGPDPTAAETDAYLLDLVNATLAELQAASPDVIDVTEGPTLRTIADHAAVSLKVQYGTTSLYQKVAIVVSEDDLRYWLLVLTTDSASYPRMDEGFERMLAGFETAETSAPPDGPVPPDLPWILLGVVGGVVATVVIALFLLRRRNRALAPPGQ